MRWGTGEEAAVERMKSLTLEELQSMGVTAEMAAAWVALYRYVARRNPANGSARGRAVLMEYATKLLRGAQ
jgi:hypothetical protein